MKNLYESILRPNADVQVMQQVELDAILKKHHWYVESAYWQGNALKITFDGRGYMDNIDKVAEDLKCKNFIVYPWAIVSAAKLDGYSIKAGTRLDITCQDIQNCVLEAGHRVTISGKSDKDKLKLVRNDFVSKALRLNNMNGATMVGNDFDQIESLTITRMGPKIEKIVLDWNYVTNNKGAWLTYPRPSGSPDLDLDPIKSLGLDKHFRNLQNFTLSLGCGGSEDYIQFNASGQRRYKRFDWGVDGLWDLNNGWQAVVIKDARCV